jgi:2-iminobutanoate/2-iminopropanoate deaminase
MTRRHELQLPSRPVLSHSADAVLSDDLLFVAGVLPVDREGRLVGEDDVAAQAERVFDDLGAILAAGGCAFSGVARLNVYLTDILDAAHVGDAHQRAFGASRPAGAVVEVRGLAVLGAKIEVDAVAVVG